MQPRSPSLGGEARDLLVATGFLRMGVDGSATDALSDRDAVRNQVLADTLKIVSTSLLRIVRRLRPVPMIHRYDPIPQSDYYRLRAVFEPAYTGSNGRRPRSGWYRSTPTRIAGKSAEVEAGGVHRAREREAKQAQFIADALAKHLGEV